MVATTERQSRRFAAKRTHIKSLIQSIDPSNSSEPKPSLHPDMNCKSSENAQSRSELVSKWWNENTPELFGFQPQQLPCSLTFDLIPSGKHLSKSDLHACFRIIETTSSRDYKLSSIGWSPREKKIEMADENMMYLLVRQGPTQNVNGGPTPELIKDQSLDMEDVQNPSLHNDEHLQEKENTNPSSMLPGPQNEGQVIGFISFMLTNDDPPYQAREVVYIYEIHLHKELRGHGLGSQLMKIPEGAGKAMGITKIMLTVFSRNKKARALYERKGYSKDHCSPHDRSVRGRTIKADYVIMSKRLD